MNFSRHVFTLTFLILLTALPATAGEWERVETTDASFPVARHEASFVSVGDTALLLGGRGGKPVNLYRPADNTWTSGRRPPIELHHIQSTVRDGRVFVVGAMTGPYPNEFGVPYALTYDPAEDRWTRAFDIPWARVRGATGNVIVSDTLYMACGIRDGHRAGHSTMFDAYDFTTGQWTVLPDAPRPRDHFAAAHVDGKIYLLGGRRSRAPKNTFGDLEPLIDVYNIEEQTWSTLSEPLPTPRAGLFVTIVGAEILVLGGESMSQPSAHNEVEALDTITGTWRSRPSLLQGRHGTGVVRIGDTLYVASGSGNRGGGPELTTLEKLSLDDCP